MVGDGGSWWESRVRGHNTAQNGSFTQPLSQLMEHSGSHLTGEWFALLEPLLLQTRWLLKASPSSVECWYSGMLTSSYLVQESERCVLCVILCKVTVLLWPYILHTRLSMLQHAGGRSVYSIGWELSTTFNPYSVYWLKLQMNFILKGISSWSIHLLVQIHVSSLTIL